MKASDAYARLRRLRRPVVETADAAAALQTSTVTASKTLSRLAESGLVTVVRHGTWWLDGPVDPYVLAGYLTPPFDGYLSLQTALHLRGMVEQIPEVHYVVSLARSQRVVTSVATFSIHHIAPEVFGGYEETSGGVRLATAEKALFDFAYLSAGRSRLFTSLPELTLPRGFRRSVLKSWVAKIPSDRSRTITERKLEAFIRSAGEASEARTPQLHGSRPR
jgi:predicted transcriptional regulator of viral defense system